MAEAGVEVVEVAVVRLADTEGVAAKMAAAVAVATDLAATMEHLAAVARGFAHTSRSLFLADTRSSRGLGSSKQRCRQR